MKRHTTSAVYECGFGCGTTLDRDGTHYLTGDPMLPLRVCGPDCTKRPADATVMDRQALDEALAAAYEAA